MITTTWFQRRSEEIKFSRGAILRVAALSSFTRRDEQMVSLLGHLRVSTFRFHHFYRQLRVLSLSRNARYSSFIHLDILESRLNARLQGRKLLGTELIRGYLSFG